MKIRVIVTLLLLVLGGLTGWKAYNYFFDTSAAVVVFSGIDEDEFYKGEVQCSLASSKTGISTFFLDGEPLDTAESISLNRCNDPYYFILPVATLSQGKHTIGFEFYDATFHHNKVKSERHFYVDNSALKAAFVTPDENFKVFQGRTLHVQFHVNKSIDQAYIRALSQQYPCYPESKESSIYECFIPIPCEESPNDYILSAEIIDSVGNTVILDNKFQILNYPFKKQTLHIAKEKIEQEKKLGLSIAEREATLEMLAQSSSKEKLWRGAFCTPIDIARISCEFGTIRTTQEKGRYMHKALDVYNMPKSVVWAPQAGKVVAKERFEDSGNTIVIDHGYGLLSLFYHLDDFADISIGQQLAKGNPIGTLGKTGYATGYHLHWEMRLNNVAVDPLQWTKSTF